MAATRPPRVRRSTDGSWRLRLRGGRLPRRRPCSHWWRWTRLGTRALLAPRRTRSRTRPARGRGPLGAPPLQGVSPGLQLLWFSRLLTGVRSQKVRSAEKPLTCFLLHHHPRSTERKRQPPEPRYHADLYASPLPYRLPPQENPPRSTERCSREQDSFC